MMAMLTALICLYSQQTSAGLTAAPESPAKVTLMMIMTLTGAILPCLPPILGERIVRIVRLQIKTRRAIFTRQGHSALPYLTAVITCNCYIFEHLTSLKFL
jgi:hypothetical protein